MKSKMIFIILLFYILFSCDTNVNDLAESHECEYCRHYFKNNTLLEYPITRFRIAKNKYSYISERSNVESVFKRSYFGGRYIRAVQKKENEKFRRHLYCFIGQDEHFFKNFFSSKIPSNVKKGEDFRELEFKFDVGEYSKYFNILDWQKQSARIIRFNEVEGDFIFLGDWRDSLKLNACLNK